MISEFLRPREIAPLLGVTTGRLYQMIAAGEIPYVRIGRRIHIPRKSWEEWLAAMSEAARSAVTGGSNGN